ncbi:MAG: hypothetical protein ACR2KS_04660 [Candidatus Eremiobacter antarcticus]|nr:hypothetical protein [Candidatus Eremiobacteraeota bacterium]MBC5807311.1 hypothetical protein [Candidatus Eremiobacteraeota bacterium]
MTITHSLSDEGTVGTKARALTSTVVLPAAAVAVLRAHKAAQGCPAPSKWAAIL